MLDLVYTVLWLTGATFFTFFILLPLVFKYSAKFARLVWEREDGKKVELGYWRALGYLIIAGIVGAGFHLVHQLLGLFITYFVLYLFLKKFKPTFNQIMIVFTSLILTIVLSSVTINYFLGENIEQLERTVTEFQIIQKEFVRTGDEEAFIRNMMESKDMQELVKIINSKEVQDALNSEDMQRFLNSEEMKAFMKSIEDK